MGEEVKTRRIGGLFQICTGTLLLTAGLILNHGVERWNVARALELLLLLIAVWLSITGVTLLSLNLWRPRAGFPMQLGAAILFSLVLTGLYSIFFLRLKSRTRTNA
jgi:hypothetical protein